MGNYSKEGNSKKSLTLNVAVTAAMAALLCVIAPFSIPVGAVPITLATFAVYLISCSYKCSFSVVAVLLYIAIGAVGLPVFSLFSGGIQKIVGVTGGYIVGYIPCAAIIGFLTDKFESKKYIYPLSMTLGTVACYTLGTLKFMNQTHNSFLQSLTMCVIPFLLGDAVKITAASVLGYKVRKALKKFNFGR